MTTGKPENFEEFEDTASMPPDSRPTIVEAETHRRIGPYRLLHVIGEGGMGEVWVADQLEPVRRRVAVKVIKAGMDTKQVAARFEAERQALAMMEHPAIAKVLDGGATSEGRPFFVMEYVRGVSITEYCDSHRVPTEERLRLFVEVCDGVQHAHQKAVIHRDLKPSNILVSLVDGKAQPKIIDFGIAKATGHRLTERTLFTEIGSVVGTPEYMSPEQADVAGQDIDTRTDIYSLGVILYELLTGLLPFASGDLRSSNYEELLRKLREVEPPRPSARAATLGEKAVEAARCRDTDPISLRRQLKGDLDAITMKALAKERSRRYGTPSEFAADLRRFLLHEPVQARPAGRAYRLSKYIRKHRAGVAVAGVVFLLLVAFTASTWNQARRIADERDRANEERDRATRNGMRKARAIVFLTGMFKPSKAAIASGKRITSLDVLDNAAQKLVPPTTEDPESQNELRLAVADGYTQLGLLTKSRMLRSIPDFRTDLEVRRRGFGEDHPTALEAQLQLAWALWVISDYAEAESLTRDVLRRRARAAERQWLDLRARRMLAGMLSDQEQYAESEQLLRQALPLAKDLGGPVGSAVAQVMMRLAGVLAHEGNFKEAETLRTSSLRIASELSSPGTREWAGFEYGSACILALEGRRAEALKSLEAALDHGLWGEDRMSLGNDKDFDSLQDDSRFRALVSRSRQIDVEAGGQRP